MPPSPPRSPARPPPAAPAAQSRAQGRRRDILRMRQVVDDMQAAKANDCVTTRIALHIIKSILIITVHSSSAGTIREARHRGDPEGCRLRVRLQNQSGIYLYHSRVVSYHF